ncbi:MAG: phage tail tape measure protein [Aeromonas veronii]
MSNDIRTELVLDLGGNLAQRAKRYESAMGSMAARSARSMALMKKSAELVGQGLDSLGNRYTALVGGAGMASGVNHVVKMDKSLRSLQVTSGKTAEEMKEIQAQLLATAQASHIRIDYSELETGVAQIVEMTGDLDWALANRETMAMTISASGATGDAVGAFMAELQKLGLTADQTQEAIARMLSQGKEGAFTLQNLASLGPRVVSAYATSGRSGTAMLQETGAVLQMIRRTSGSAEMAATSFESLMRSFSNNKVLKDLQKRGIQVFDPEKLKQGEKVLRPINELMEEIVIKTKGDVSKITAVFTDSEASRAFNSFISEFKATGKFEILDKFMEANADAKVLIDDSKIMADSYASLLSNLNNAWMEFATNEMGGPIEELAASLRSLKQEDVQRWFEMGKAIAYVGAGAIAARKLWQAGMAVKDGVDWWRSAGQSKDGAEGTKGGRAGLMGMKLPLPVYVVNDRMSLMPDEMGGQPDIDSSSKNRRGGKRRPGAPSPRGQKHIPANKMLPRGGGLLAAGVGAIELAPTLMSDDVSTAGKVQATGEAVGGAAGAWAGAAAGAALGSFVPIVGTALGGMLGGIVGYVGGQWAGEQVAEQINQSLDLTVKLEGAPGTKAEVVGMKSSSDNLNSQVYYGAGMR